MFSALLRLGASAKVKRRQSAAVLDTNIAVFMAFNFYALARFLVFELLSGFRSYDEDGIQMLHK